MANKNITNFTFTPVDVLPVIGRASRPDYDEAYLTIIRDMVPDKGGVKVEGFSTYSQANGFATAMRTRMQNDGLNGHYQLTSRILKIDDDTVVLYLGKIKAEA